MLNTLEPEGAIAAAISRISKRLDDLESLNFGGQTPFVPSYAMIQDQKSAGTNGGDATAGSWFTRVLNTIVSDPDGIVSLVANQFTLQPGTYNIAGSSPGLGVDRMKIRLRNITLGTTVQVGQSAFASAPDSGHNFSEVFAPNVVLTTSTIFEIQMRVNNSVASFGAGVGTGAWGEVEVFTSVKIAKIA